MSGPWYRPVTVAVMAVCIVAMPSEARGQKTVAGGEDGRGLASPGRETEIGLALGALTPLADMARTQEGASLGLSTSFSVGAGVTRWLSPRWGIAVEGLWATGGPDVRSAADGGAAPGDDDGESPDGGATYLAGTAGIVHRFSAFAGVVEPRIGVAAGIRHVELDESGPFGPVSETGPAAVLSAGVRTAIDHRTSLEVELRDVVSSTEIEGVGGGGALQNDLLVLVGVSFSL